MKSSIYTVIKKLFSRQTPKITENYVNYVEKDTECDKCYNKNACIEMGYLVNSTISSDTREHYIKGRGCNCIKGCEAFLGIKLSEILRFLSTEETKDFTKRAIEQFGDITYRELLSKHKIF